MVVNHQLRDLLAADVDVTDEELVKENEEVRQPNEQFFSVSFLVDLSLYTFETAFGFLTVFWFRLLPLLFHLI